ncbi:MAG: hypothetical protein Q8920_13360 [Bacillota bacterium]|nr:hypothetical protein [Bacillota bacterium]
MKEMNNNVDNLLLLIQQLPQDKGEVIKKYISGKEKLILIMDHIPWNAGSNSGLANLLRFFTYPGYINLVGTESADNSVDTEWLANLSRNDMTKEVVGSFVQNLRLSPGEYLSVLPDNHITLWGIDDMEIYQKQMPLWIEALPLVKHMRDTNGDFYSAPENIRALMSAYNEFDRLDRQRAEKMVNNLLKKLGEHDEIYKLNAAVMICCGHLPEYAGEYLERINVSHVIIRPFSSSKDEFETYESLLNSQSNLKHDRLKPKKTIKRTPFSRFIILILSLWEKIRGK